MEFNKLVPELAVRDFAKSLDFYVSVLGFTVEYDRPSENFAFLSFHGAQIMIEKAEGAWKTGELEFPLGRGVNFQIEVPSIQPLLQGLRSVAVPLFREPKEVWRKVGSEEVGEVEFLVQDPDGYLLRFSEWLGNKSIISI